MILIIDDEPIAIRPYVEAIKRAGYECHMLSALNEVEVFLHEPFAIPTLIVLDLMFPGAGGFSTAFAKDGNHLGIPLYAGLRQHFASVPIIVFTAAPNLAASFFSNQKHCTIAGKGLVSPKEFVGLIRSRLGGSANGIRDRLRRCPRGHAGEKDYEKLIGDAFEYLFVPPLREVRRQVARSNRHKIRDIIMTNNAPGHFWSSLRVEYGSRHIVVELKNYADPIGSQQVAQLADYLRRPTIGRFGILVSRVPPSSSAIQERAEAHAQGILVLFLDDREIERMLRLREDGEDPVSVLQDLKTQFELDN